MTADVEVTVTVPGDLADELRALSSSVDKLEQWSVTAIAHRERFLLAAAVKRTPRPFQVGDRVRWGDRVLWAKDRFGVVKALDADLAWVHIEGVVSGDWYATFYVSELSHVEDNQ